MNRLALLLPILLCLTFEPRLAAPVPRVWGAAYLGLLGATVLLARFLAVRAAAQTHERNLIRPISRLFRLLSVARLMALASTAAGLYLFGWADVIDGVLGTLHLTHSDLAAGVLITGPAYLAWLGLHWAQYPAEGATRASAMLAQLEAGLPVREGPSLGRYLDHQIRIGPGAMLGPMVAIFLLRDVAFFILRRAGWEGGGGGGGVDGQGWGAWVDAGVYLSCVLAVFVLSPLLLTRILRTARMPNDDLRRRLEALARRAGVKFRDILYWDTGGSMGNALVTGVLPPVRYVLLSDVLVETMTDEQIEAVFAHELGHIVHRHIAWYAAFLVSGSFLLEWLPGGLAWAQARLGVPLYPELSATVASLSILLFVFGFVSRWSERQADVFAARAIGAGPELTPARPLEAEVGPHGAAVFGGALREVARINHMPSAAWGYLHGSIATRVETLRAMGLEATSTRRFDARMRLMRAGLLLVVVGGVLSVVVRTMR